MDEKQFLKDLREAAKKLKCKSVLDNGRLRFILGDGEPHCPITLISAAREPAIYYSPSFQIKKAAKLNKIRAALREEINYAADLHPRGYNRKLRRQMMRAVGRWQ